MAIIPPFFMDAVVALGIKTPELKKNWIGTGFLVGRKEKSDPSRSTIYIITNKHVVNNQMELYVRFNHSGATGVCDLPMLIIDQNGTKNYSEHIMPDADVVAIQIVPQVIVDNNLSLSFISLEDHALTLNQMKETGVDEGGLVYALGFPMNLVGDVVKAPVCRLGCISRVADAFNNPDSATEFLIDAQTFPGNSGGPVVSRPEHVSINGTPKNTKANLIGILSAYIPYQEALYSRQTGRTRMVQEENSGLTIVHPVDRIKEVVEVEYTRAEMMRMMSQVTNQLDLEKEQKEAASV